MRNCFLKVIDTRVQTCCVRIEAPSCTRSTYCPHPRTTSEPARQWWEEVRPLLPLAAPSGAALVHNTLEEQAQVSKRAPGAGPPLCCLSHLSPSCPHASSPGAFPLHRAAPERWTTNSFCVCTVQGTQKVSSAGRDQG